MELIEGPTLAERIAQGALPLQEALAIARQIAAALEAAHGKGIVHRDLKPANIKLTAEGTVKVLDFGLAKAQEAAAAGAAEGSPTLTATQVGTILGTAGYMSPEQASGKPVDKRADIWSFGVVLWEMLAGKRLFDGETASHALAAVLTKEPDLQQIPVQTRRLLQSCLEKDPKRRLRDIGDWARLIDLDAELWRLEASTPGGGPPPADVRATDIRGAAEAGAFRNPDSIGTGIRRRKKRAGLAVVALLAVAAAVTLYVKRVPALSARDSVVLADFVNTTGDTAFDPTLREALAVDLEQSPFLNIVSDERVRETLSYMGRSPEERLTREVAREVCQRRGVKALLAGAITNLGSHYVISLEAIDGATGDVIARQQSEAESKERVLRALGEAVTRIRGKLGESLNSIQKYDAPIEQATTSSLDALKAYSLAMEEDQRSRFREAITYTKRAVQLDPNFARAYMLMATCYGNLGQGDFAAQFIQKAFELRERSSQLERLVISWGYYHAVTGEMDKAIESAETLKQIYPRDSVGRNHVAISYRAVGQYEKALDEFRESNRLSPTALGYGNLSGIFIFTNQFAEAREVCQQAAAQKMDSVRCRGNLYLIAFVSGDTAGMKRYAPPPALERGVAAFAGRLGRMRELTDLSLKPAPLVDSTESAAAALETQATSEAWMGDCRHAKEDVFRGLAIARTSASIRWGALVLAICGEASRAGALRDEYAGRFPRSTLAKSVQLPEIDASIAIHDYDPASAIRDLEAAIPYSGAEGYRPEYLRGQAYLLQKSGKEASAEFQKVWDHRGLHLTGPLWPLAHLGLARAAALMGDTSRSRKAYQDFFALWKDADPDLPVLLEAKAEYAKLP